MVADGRALGVDDAVQRSVDHSPHQNGPSPAPREHAPYHCPPSPRLRPRRRERSRRPRPLRRPRHARTRRTACSRSASRRRPAPNRVHGDHHERRAHRSRRARLRRRRGRTSTFSLTTTDVVLAAEEGAPTRSSGPSTRSPANPASRCAARRRRERWRAPSRGSPSCSAPRAMKSRWRSPTATRPRRSASRLSHPRPLPRPASPRGRGRGRRRVVHRGRRPDGRPRPAPLRPSSSTAPSAKKAARAAGRRGGRRGPRGMSSPLMMLADGDWSITATLTDETEEVDGVECVVITIEAEVEAEIEMGQRGRRDRAAGQEGPRLLRGDDLQRRVRGSPPLVRRCSAPRAPRVRGIHRDLLRAGSGRPRRDGDVLRHRDLLETTSTSRDRHRRHRRVRFNRDARRRPAARQGFCERP